MTPRLVGAAPWTREAIRQYRHRFPDLAAWLELDIPDGHYVVLTVDRRPGQWGAVLMCGEVEVDGSVEVARTTGHPTIGGAVAAALYAAGVRNA